MQQIWITLQVHETNLYIILEMSSPSVIAIYIILTWRENQLKAQVKVS